MTKYHEEMLYTHTTLVTANDSATAIQVSINMHPRQTTILHCESKKKPLIVTP